MATEDINVVDPDNGGGANYTSLALWEDGEDGDIVSADVIAVAKCRCTEGSADPSTATTIVGWTTDATRHIKIWTDPSESYRHSGVYSTSKYRITSGDNNGLNINENYVKVIGIQFYVADTSSRTGISITSINAGGSLIEIDSCLIRLAANDAVYERGIYAADADATLAVRNTLVYGIGANGSSRGIQAVCSTTIENCTVITGNKGIDEDGAVTVVCKNTYASGPTSFIGSFTFTTCASSDATNRTGVAKSIAVNTDNFTNVTAGSENFHLPGTGSALYGVGTNLSADFTKDIDGVTRPSSGAWCIGVDEYIYSVPSAGGGSYSLTLDGSSYGISGTASQLVKATICGLTTASYEQSGTAAELLRQLKIAGAGGTYEKSGTTAGLLALLKLIGGSESYEISGTVNSLFRQLALSAGLTSYTISGTAANFTGLPGSYILDASWSGAQYWRDTEGNLILDTEGQPIVIYDDLYKIVPKVVALLRTYPLSAGSENYSVSGTSATLFQALNFGAVTASYAISGTAADLTGAYILDASWSRIQYWLDTEGNPILDTEGQPIVIYDDLYKIVPKVAELLRSYPLSTGGESYSVSGTVSDLLKLAKLISGNGAYDYSGKSVSVDYQRLFAAAGATYGQTGTAVDLSTTNSLAALAGSYSLLGTEVRFIPTLFIVGSGNYNLLGTQISTIFSHVLPGAGGEYVLTGTDNPLYYGFFITPQGGNYLSTGVDADLRAFSGLSSYGGSYLVSGTPSDLKFLHALGLGSSQYDITGTDLDIFAVRALILGSDSYVITGEDVAFDAFYLSTLGGGSYLLNGVPITFGSDYILYARPGTINYSGKIALLWYSAEIIGNVLMFLDIKTAEIILAVKSPQLTLEFNERN